MCYVQEMSQFSNDSCEDIVVGQLYQNKSELKAHLGMLAIRKNYEFKVIKSDKDRWVVGCVDDNCKWRLRAIKLQDLS